MRRRPSLPIATLAVALLVLTAGCASLTGGDGTATPTDVQTPATDAGATATDDPGDGSDDGSADDEPANGESTDDGGATDGGGATDDAVVRASLVGVTATDLNRDDLNVDQQAAIADALGVDEQDVRVRPVGTVEVFDASVTRSELVDALGQQGIDTAAGRVYAGVTDRTQEETVRTLTERLDVLDVEATVEAATVDDRRGVAVTPADGNVSRVREAIGDRGTVEIVAHFPANATDETAAPDDYRDVTLLTNADFESVGAVQRPGGGNPTPAVPVTVADEAAANFSSGLVTFGFTGEGVANCPTAAAREDPANASGYCLFTVHDGEVVYAAQMSAALADQMASGEWAADPQFVMTAANESEAQELRAHLVAGALPTRLSVAG